MKLPYAYLPKNRRTEESIGLPVFQFVAEDDQCGDDDSSNTRYADTDGDCDCDVCNVSSNSQTQSSAEIGWDKKHPTEYLDEVAKPVYPAVDVI